MSSWEFWLIIAAIYDAAFRLKTGHRHFIL